jgi:hypothetical protein
VGILSFVDKTQLEPGCSVLLHNKVSCLLLLPVWHIVLAQKLAATQTYVLACMVPVSAATVAAAAAVAVTCCVASLLHDCFRLAAACCVLQHTQC